MLRYRQFGAATASRGGFTLTELAAAVVVAGIVALSVGAAMTLGTEMSVEARQTLAVKRDAAYALRFIQRRVRQMYTDEIEAGLNAENAPRLTLYPGTADEAYAEQTGDDLVYVDSAGETTVLIGDTLESVAFALEDGENSTDKLLSITLTMDDGGRTLALPESLTLIRNQPE